jgi:glycosyltransferase involved in cell wall biosynthesis
LEPHFINWQPQTNTIGFVGTLNHLPNSEGIELLAQKLQLSGFSGKFKVVGASADIGYKLEKKYPFIKYCGALNNEQLKNEISTWCLFLNPVFWYARGSSTKLSQGINWGIPVITTPAGIRGYELVDHKCVTADNTPSTFAQTAMQALSSTPYLNELKQTSEDNATGFKTDIWANKLSLFLNAL